LHRKWINEKDFVTDIVFRYTITVCHSLLWLPEEKPQQWFSVLPYIAKL